MEGALGSKIGAASNRADVNRGPGHAGEVGSYLPKGKWGTAANAGVGAPAVAPTRRQRASEAATSSSAPSVEGRRGSLANESRIWLSPHARVTQQKPANVPGSTTHRTRSCHGEKPWHSKMGPIARTM